jgi:hypothetical protein
MLQKLTAPKYLYAILLFFILLKSLESLHPFGHGDALYYHLTIAKVWLESGWNDAHLQVCGALQGGLLEYLYILPVSLFQNSILQLTSSQFLHFFLTFGLLTFFIYKFYLKDNFYASIFFLISIFTINKGSDFFLYAKNDGLMAALGFIAVIMILDSKFKKLKRYNLIIAILLGVIPLVKINGAMITLILNLIYLVQNLKTKSYRKLLINWSIQICLISLLLWRNWHFYHSPFFPVFLNIFPGDLTPAMISTFSYFMASKPTWTSIGQIFGIFFTAKIIMLSVPFFFINNFRKKKHQLNQIFIISLFILILLILKSGGIVYERWFFVCYFLNLFFIFFSWNQAFKPKLMMPLILIVLLIDSRLDQSVKRIKNLKSKYQNIESFSEKNKIWKYVPENSKILSDRWNEFFHAPPGVRIHSAECNIQAGFLPQCTEQDLLKLEAYNYAILFNNNDNPCYKKIKSSSNIITKIDGYELYKLGEKP